MNAAPTAPTRVNPFAAHQFDHVLPELTQSNSFPQEIGMFFQESEDVSLSRGRVHAEQQITPSSMSLAFELARTWRTGQMPQTRDISPGIS